MMLIKLIEKSLLEIQKMVKIFEALDNKKYKLKKGMCVISDKSRVLGLGGIIGGTKTSTEFETKNILLESAYFITIFNKKNSKRIKFKY